MNSATTAPFLGTSHNRPETSGYGLRMRQTGSLASRCISGFVATLCLMLMPNAAMAHTPQPQAAPSVDQLALKLTPAEAQWLRAHPKIRLGVDRFYAPYSHVNRHGVFEGISADLIKLVGEQLGVEFIPIAPRKWADLLTAAQRKEIDVIATAAYTPDRETYLAFTEVYLKTPLVIMTRSNDHSLRSAADLGQRTVALVESYSSTQRVIQEHPQINRLFVRGPLDGLIAVATGQADAYIGAIGVNSTIASENGIFNLRIAANYDIDNGQRFGVRKDWAMLPPILEKALAAIPESKKAEIYHRWIPQDAPTIRSGRPVLNDAEQRWLLNHPSIRFGLVKNDEPIEFLDSQRRPAGFIPRHLDLLEEKTGLKFERVWFSTRKEMLSQLAAREIDMISTQMPSQYNGAHFPFSDPVQHSAMTIFTQKSAPYLGDLLDLRGQSVSLSKHSPALPLMRRFSTVTLAPEATPLAALEAVSKGQANAAIVDADTGQYLLKKYDIKELRAAHTPAGEATSLRFAIRPDWPELIQIVNKAIAATSPEEAAHIRRTTLDLSPLRAIPREQIIFWAQIAAVIVLSIFLIQAYVGNRRLRHEAKQRRLADIAAHNSERRFSLTFEQAAVGIALVAPDGSWLRVNRHLCEMLDYRETDLLQRRFQDVTHPDDLAIDLERVAQLLAGEIDTYSMEKRYLRSDGDIVWGLLTVTLMRRPDESPDYFISVVENITQRKRDAAHIEYLAYRDALTGLPNRTLIADRVAQAIAEASRAGHRVALFFLDLDDFKAINDTLGHQVGDQLLLHVAERLKGCIRVGDSVGRQGGDEFLLLISGIEEDAPAPALAAIAEKVFEQLIAPFQIETHELSVQTSIGIAVFPDDGKDFETLLRKADTAMYSAKASGRNAYHFFVEQMNLDAVRFEQLRNGLRYALERNELALHYQPQRHLASGELVGIEALLRWTHPQLGKVSPADFIPVAEDTGLIIAIGEWVLNEACRQAANWQHAGLGKLVIAVNLSAVQFKRGNLERTVADALAGSGLAPQYLELELTESILIQDAESVLNIVRRLKALGVRLSIDDFGTGYSSLSYLKRFPVDKLKIDQSFVRDMLNDPDDEVIVESVIGLAKNLGLATIAEGIETEGQLAALIRLGCDECQGYFIARPMPAEDFPAYYSRDQHQ